MPLLDDARKLRSTLRDLSWLLAISDAAPARLATSSRVALAIIFLATVSVTPSRATIAATAASLVSFLRILAPFMIPNKPSLSRAACVTPAAIAIPALRSSPSISFQVCPVYIAAGASIDAPPVTGASTVPAIVFAIYGNDTAALLPRY